MVTTSRIRVVCRMWRTAALQYLLFLRVRGLVSEVFPIRIRSCQFLSAPSSLLIRPAVYLQYYRGCPRRLEYNTYKPPLPPAPHEEYIFNFWALESKKNEKLHDSVSIVLIHVSTVFLASLCIVLCAVCCLCLTISSQPTSRTVIVLSAHHKTRAGRGNEQEAQKDTAQTHRRFTSIYKCR